MSLSLLSNQIIKAILLYNFLRWVSDTSQTSSRNVIVNKLWAGYCEAGRHLGYNHCTTSHCISTDAGLLLSLHYCRAWHPNRSTPLAQYIRIINLLLHSTFRECACENIPIVMQSVTQQGWGLEWGLCLLPTKNKNTKVENDLTADHKLLPNEQNTTTNYRITTAHCSNVMSTFLY